MTADGESISFPGVSHPPARQCSPCHLPACPRRWCPAAAPASARARPSRTPRHRGRLMRDFMGLNVHTVQFKPELYAPVCRLLRDYHPIEWDFGDDTSRADDLPDGRQPRGLGPAVRLVGQGRLRRRRLRDVRQPAAGRSGRTPPATPAPTARPSPASSAPRGGKGWSRPSKSATSRPSTTRPQYRTIFENMARGLRAGDPKLTIATCAVMTGKTDQWSKPLSAVAGPGRPVRRAEHPQLPVQGQVADVAAVVPGGPVDPVPQVDRRPGPLARRARAGQAGLAHRVRLRQRHQAAPADGPWKQWVGVSDEQQARYIVRSFLVLSATDLDRAYLYFFNDKDEPQLHGASGITRNFKPKPSFYAMAHLYRTLGDYRFARAVAKKEGELYCFEYEKPDGGGATATPQAPRAGVRRVVADGGGRSSKRVVPVGAAVPASTGPSAWRRPRGRRAGGVEAGAGRRRGGGGGVARLPVGAVTSEGRSFGAGSPCGLAPPRKARRVPNAAVAAVYRGQGSTNPALHLFPTAARFQKSYVRRSIARPPSER